MNNKIRRHKTIVSLFLVWTFLIGCLPAAGQDLIPVSDITGGASVFVFRTSRKAPPKKFVSTEKSRRTKAQRIETAKKVVKQSTFVAKARPSRPDRAKSVEPSNLPKSPDVMPKNQAAKVFAGVGEYYIENEQIDKAIELFRIAVPLDAKNKNAQTGLSEALALKGNQLLTQDKAREAVVYFEESIKYNPNNAVAHYGLGEVLDDLGKETEAFVNYEKALSYDKDLTEIYVPLGILYYQKNEIAKADEFLGKALKISPDDPQTQYFLGLVRYAQSRDQEAFTALQKFLKADRNSAEAHFYAGRALVRLNRTKEAIVEFEEAARLRPKYFEALFDLGAAHYELENYSEAVNRYKAATLVKNDSIEAQANLGDAYRLAGNFDDAESSYNVAISLLPRDKEFSRDDAAQIYSYAGYVIGRQCEKNMRRALPCRWNTTVKNLEKAIEMSPNAADYTNLGWAYYNAGKIEINQKKEAEGKAKLEKAKIALQKAVAMNPSYIEAPLLNLGVALIDLGDYAGAINALKQVAAKRSDWNFANYALGVAYRKNGDVNNSLAQFRKAVDKEPNYIAALSALGESEFRNNNKKEAEKIIARLRQLNAVNEAKKLEILLSGVKFGY